MHLARFCREGFCRSQLGKRLRSSHQKRDGIQQQRCLAPKGVCKPAAGQGSHSCSCQQTADHLSEQRWLSRLSHPVQQQVTSFGTAAG